MTPPQRRPRAGGGKGESRDRSAQRRSGAPAARGARGAADARVVWPPAKRERARDAIEDLMRERGLSRRFDREVERAARRARDRGADVRGDAHERRDLTDLATFTIDPASARDFDDAISAQFASDGAIRVWVHIADVSAYVEESSVIDIEARRRATSVYVPGAVEPMLPRALSNDACSLVPGSERLAVTAELEARGASVARASFYRSVIRSDERLDYERVDRIFDGAEEAPASIAEPLRAAREASAALARARAERGALVLDSVEPEFLFDDDGEVTEVIARVQTESHRLIEHLMIAANEAVAELLQKQRTPCLYRVHERPDGESVQRLVAQLASLDVPTPALPERMSSTQAADLVAEISRRVEKHVNRTGGGREALGRLILRSLKQAYYAPTNIGHAGLGSSAYCHFTSPIRRYPDLVCHRALLATLGDEERAPRAHELRELGAWTSQREREAMVIERDADDVASSFALERELYERGWEEAFAGEVVGLIAAGAFVAFAGAPANAGPRAVSAPAKVARQSRYEGMLPFRTLAGPAGEREWWQLNEEGTIAHGRNTGATLRLGEVLIVRVVRVDARAGRVDLERAPETPVGRGASTGQRRRR